MFIELVDVLRCVRPHEDSWLVLSTAKMDDRQVIEGELGCPLCGARYAVTSGTAHFGSSRRSAPDGARADTAVVADTVVVADAAFRVAALLDVSDSGGVVVLTGGYAELASALQMLSADTQFVIANPALPVPAVGYLSAITTDEVLPLATGSCRGLVADESHASDAWLSECARVLKAGGRLIAPAAANMPADTRELARDGSAWVAERTAASSTLVTIATGRRK